MNPATGTDEFLTRGTAWVSLWLYAAGEIHRVVQRATRITTGNASRWWNSLGCATFLVHVACAFQFYHGWSHAAAYAETARQTAALLGRSWGGGLYVNYLFALVWLGEVTWSWWGSRGYRDRPRWVTWGVRCFFLFMIVNGTVVFVQGPMRWVGVCLCVALLFCWSRRAA